MYMFYRKCPSCDKELSYTLKWNRDAAQRNGLMCKSCVKVGPKNPFYKKPLPCKPINKGRKLSPETCKKISESLKGRRYSSETRRKMRLAAIRRIERAKGKCSPNYNPKACKLIEEYGKQHGYNFQHAENGGEFHIKELGYWVDGYDKEKNVVIEYDEPKHYRNGNLRVRDLERQKAIENVLGCVFIRIGECR